MDASSGMSMGFTIVWLVVLFGIMYFLMIRPQKKEQKRVQAMLSDMAVGDSIVTTSGFYGVIIDMTEEDVIVEFGNNKNCHHRYRNRKLRKPGFCPVPCRPVCSSYSGLLLYGTVRGWFHLVQAVCTGYGRKNTIYFRQRQSSLQ